MLVLELFSKTEACVGYAAFILNIHVNAYVHRVPWTVSGFYTGKLGFSFHCWVVSSRFKKLKISRSTENNLKVKTAERNNYTRTVKWQFIPVCIYWIHSLTLPQTFSLLKMSCSYCVQYHIDNGTTLFAKCYFLDSYLHGRMLTLTLLINCLIWILKSCLIRGSEKCTGLTFWETSVPLT